MKKINTLTKNSQKRVATILMALTKKEKHYLNSVPLTSLEKLKNGSGVATDWQNVGFRIHVAFFLAKEIYIQDTVDEIAKVVSELIQIAKRNVSDNNHNWLISNVEYDSLLSVLEAMAIMQDECTRKDQLAANYLAKDAMNAIVKSLSTVTSES